MVSKRGRILVLHSEVMGYTEALFRELALSYQLTVFHQEDGLKTPHRVEAHEGVEYHDRERLDTNSLLDVLADPELIGVFAGSGWAHPHTRTVLRRARALGVPTVIGLDNHWKGSIRQRVASLVSRWNTRRLAGGVFAAGPEQYEFARRLGFRPNEIEIGVYSADTSSFEERGARPLATDAPSRLLFVGRLVPVKGILEFARTFERLVTEQEANWELRVVGNGPLERQLRGIDHVNLRGFLPPQAVVQEMRAADAFVLPSLHEPWGVVIHEAALVGLPILCGEDVGAARRFVVGGINGLRFKVHEEAGREHAVRSLLAWSRGRLIEMGAASRKLGEGYGVQECAARLVSLLDRQRS